MQMLGQRELAPMNNRARVLNVVQQLGCLCLFVLYSSHLRSTMMTSPPRTPPRHMTGLPGLLGNPPGTPRRPKPPSGRVLQGTKALTDKLQLGAITTRLKHQLKLQFEPDAWQTELLSYLLHGYDGILCAGTDYGKSLVFEGLAILGGKGRVVIVVCSLKALEREQSANPVCRCNRQQ